MPDVEVLHSVFHEMPRRLRAVIRVVVEKYIVVEVTAVWSFDVFFGAVAGDKRKRESGPPSREAWAACLALITQNLTTFIHAPLTTYIPPPLSSHGDARTPFHAIRKAFNASHGT